MELKEFFAAHPKIALAFSGGVDSAYLLYAAKQLGAEVRAYYVKTAFQPQFELDDAKRLAEALHADMTVLLVDILSDTRVAANPANRCYFCKKSIFSSILHAASADGCTTLIDGTNASDDAGDRPGMQALRELKVYSPLRDRLRLPRHPHPRGNADHSGGSGADGEGGGLLVLSGFYRFSRPADGKRRKAPASGCTAGTYRGGAGTNRRHAEAMVRHGFIGFGGSR